MFLDFWEHENQDIFLKSLFSYCFCIFDELYLYNPKSRKDKIDCCRNLGSYVLVKISFKWIWPIMVDLRGSKWVPGQNKPFLCQFCQPYWQCQKDLKFSKFYPNHSSHSTDQCSCNFTDTKISKIGERWYKKNKIMKSLFFFFCILITEQSLNI